MLYYRALSERKRSIFSFYVSIRMLTTLILLFTSCIIFSPSIPTLQISNHPYASPKSASQLPRAPLSPSSLPPAPSKLSPLNPRSRNNVSLKNHPFGSPSFKSTLPTRPRRPSVVELANQAQAAKSQSSSKTSEKTTGGSRRPVRAPIPSCLPKQRPPPNRALPDLPPTPPFDSSVPSPTSSEKSREEELKREMEVALILAQDEEDQQKSQLKVIVQDGEDKDEILGYGETELERKVSIEKTKGLLIALGMRKASPLPSSVPVEYQSETFSSQESANPFRATLLEIQTKTVDQVTSFENSNAIVKLNVGGKEFLTSASTLLTHSGSEFGLAQFVRECLEKGSQESFSNSPNSQSLTLQSNSSSTSLKVPAPSTKHNKRSSKSIKSMKRSESPIFHSPFLQASSSNSGSKTSFENNPNWSTGSSNCSSSSSSDSDLDLDLDSSEDEDEAKSINFHDPFALSLTPRPSLTRSEVSDSDGTGLELQLQEQVENNKADGIHRQSKRSLLRIIPDPRRSESRNCPSDVESEDEEVMPKCPDLVQSRRSSSANHNTAPQLVFTAAVSPTSIDFSSHQNHSQDRIISFSSTQSFTSTSLSSYQPRKQVSFLSIFIDRNPKLYSVLLDTLRSGSLPSNLLFQSVSQAHRHDLSGLSSVNSSSSDLSAAASSSSKVDKSILKKVEKLEVLIQEAKYRGYLEVVERSYLEIEKLKHCLL